MWTPSAYYMPNSSLVQERQVWSTDHVVGTESRHSEPPWSSWGSFLQVLGNCLPVKLPDASQGPTSKAGLAEDKPSWTCCVNTSCAETKSRFVLYCREPGVALSRVTACHPPGQTHISNRRVSVNVLGCLPPSMSHTKLTTPHILLVDRSSSLPPPELPVTSTSVLASTTRSHVLPFGSLLRLETSPYPSCHSFVQLLLSCSRAFRFFP